MHRPLKIAFISYEYPPFIQGGAGTYAYNIVKELVKMGNEVHVISPHASGSDKESFNSGLFVHRLNILHKPFVSVSTFWFSLVSQFSSLERKIGGFDIVHENGLSAFSLSKKVFPGPRVITIHHLARTSLKVKNANYFNRIKNIRGEIGISPIIEPFCIKRADRMITVSQFTKRDLIDTYNIPSSKIEVVYHGAYIENYRQPQEAKIKIRKILGIDSKPMLLFVGRLSCHKGVDILIGALQKVIEKVDARLVIVGSGIQKNYRNLAHSLGISDKIVFLGYVNNDYLKLLYSTCDVFVLPSRLEGLGIVLLEAMAAGKPIVAT